jgi:hypothetical protein
MQSDRVRQKDCLSKTVNVMASTELIDGVIASLAQIRETSPSARNTAGGGALLPELFEVCNALSDDVGLDLLRDQAERSQILRKPTFVSRKRIWRLLRNRYLEPGGDWCLQTLRNAARSGLGSPEFTSLAYLDFALRDRLTFDFITGWIWSRWNEHRTNVAQGDYLMFLDQEAQELPEVKKWTEGTRKKLARNALSALRDFGLLKGSRTKQIQRPAIAHETVFHLLCILLAEGLEGRAILEAPDWRLFLWSVDDVSHYLGQLAQRRWVRFERAGRTVILQLERLPGVVA